MQLFLCSGSEGVEGFFFFLGVGYGWTVSIQTVLGVGQDKLVDVIQVVTKMKYREK